MLGEHIVSEWETLDDMCKFIRLRASSKLGTMYPLYPLSEAQNKIIFTNTEQLISLSGYCFSYREIKIWKNCF